MRAAGLPFHFSTFPYFQRMNYRFPHGCSQKIDALFMSYLYVQTKLSRKEENFYQKSWIFWLTCVTFLVTLWVRSLTFGAMMVVSEVGGECVFLSVPSEKLSAIRGILLMVLYLLMLESEVEPSRLDFTWLKGSVGINSGYVSIFSIKNMTEYVVEIVLHAWIEIWNEMRWNCFYYCEIK